MRCEGWVRHGGAFTLGPVKWEQCKNDAVVILEVVQDGKQEKQPACMNCWNRGIEYGIKIINAVPVEQAESES